MLAQTCNLVERVATPSGIQGVSVCIRVLDAWWRYSSLLPSLLPSLLLTPPLHPHTCSPPPSHFPSLSHSFFSHLLASSSASCHCSCHRMAMRINSPDTSCVDGVSVCVCQGMRKAGQRVIESETGRYTQRHTHRDTDTHMHTCTEANAEPHTAPHSTHTHTHKQACCPNTHPTLHANNTQHTCAWSTSVAECVRSMSNTAVAACRLPAL